MSYLKGHFHNRFCHSLAMTLNFINVSAHTHCLVILLKNLADLSSGPPSNTLAVHQRKRILHPSQNMSTTFLKEN
jgi:hypothetical protein